MRHSAKAGFATEPCKVCRVLLVGGVGKLTLPFCFDTKLLPAMFTELVLRNLAKARAPTLALPPFVKSRARATDNLFLYLSQRISRWVSAPA